MDMKDTHVLIALEIISKSFIDLPINIIVYVWQRLLLTNVNTNSKIQLKNYAVQFSLIFIVKAEWPVYGLDPNAHKMRCGKNLMETKSNPYY